MLTKQDIKVIDRKKAGKPRKRSILVINRMNDIFNYTGKPAICSSFRTKQKIFEFEDLDVKVRTCENIHPLEFGINYLEDNEGNFIGPSHHFNNLKYFISDCGNVNLCEKCMKFSFDKRKTKWESIVYTLLTKFPKLQFSHMCFTVPHDHEFHKKESKKNYNKLFKAVQTVIEYFFPDSPFILALHNWSTKNPIYPHIHIHAFIIHLDKKGNYLKSSLSKRGLASMKGMYSMLIGYFEKPINLKRYYLSARKSKKKYDDPHYEIFKTIGYIIRSPLYDYCEYFRKKFPREKEITLSRKYLKRIVRLKNFQRIRFYGWLSCSILTKTLESFGIAKFENKKNLRFIREVEVEGQYVRTRLDRDTGEVIEDVYAIFSDNTCVEIDKIENFEVFSKIFYYFEKPP